MEGLVMKLQELAAFYGIKIIAAAVILVVGRWAAKGITKITQRFLNKGKVDPTIVSFVEHVTYVALMVFIVLAALAQLGIQTTSFIAVIGAAGLAIGLALQGSLANFAAGFLMIIFKPFKAGDYIEGAGVAGTVDKIQIFTTTLKTPDNKLVIIPNSKIMSDNIVNYSAHETRRVDMPFRVSYQDDIDKVRKILRNIVDNDHRILKDPAAMIIVKTLDENSVNIELRVWVKTADYWGVYFETVEEAKKQFDANGVKIPFPQRDVHVYRHGADRGKESTAEDEVPMALGASEAG
ncbi:MAG: mechanosensitive ion channel [Pseudomonadota bacterium]|jgi:small conductance mechanosensitive channel|uniref:Small-conductance mechanosensitive channel n=1 Tax=anaerobic digester metagenome TaxID=1263854 RepID=A0A485LXM6_9ZZZZ|nr:mechanosensitive ion channel [Pseudomonadota bacterium]HON37221.1 mechanosensitive ion channel [Deltaproteobacteria bacterium]HPD20021.1 mechanosensitive ion channel [Deltaproteobacteria bacterium]HRS57114.1 mechanosensitive ion channel [Desulfomonilia bacterium]HRV34239.1 mechanosensitive ion channel [Desulfomonilia bacterium]